MPGKKRTAQTPSKEEKPTKKTNKDLKSIIKERKGQKISIAQV